MSPTVKKKAGVDEDGTATETGTKQVEQDTDINMKDDKDDTDMDKANGETTGVTTTKENGTANEQKESAPEKTAARSKSKTTLPEEQSDSEAKAQRNAKDKNKDEIIKANDQDQATDQAEDQDRDQDRDQDQDREDQGKQSADNEQQDACGATDKQVAQISSKRVEKDGATCEEDKDVQVANNATTAAVDKQTQQAYDDGASTTVVENNNNNHNNNNSETTKSQSQSKSKPSSVKQPEQDQHDSRAAGKHQPRVIIKAADMPQDMQRKAINLALTALDRYELERDMAHFLKREFDDRFQVCTFSFSIFRFLQNQKQCDDAKRLFCMFTSMCVLSVRVRSYCCVEAVVALYRWTSLRIFRDT